MDYVSLLNELRAIKIDNPGTVYTPKDLTFEVRTVLSQFGYRTLTGYHRFANKDEILVSGAYNPIDEQSQKNPITITMLYSPGTTSLNIDDVDWDYTAIEICAIIGHELKHQQQWRGRNFEGGFIFNGNGSKKQLYYGDLDEIDAHGYSLALHRALRKRLGHAILPVKEDPVYAMYEDAFYENHYILDLLEKRVNKYFKQLTKKVA